MKICPVCRVEFDSSDDVCYSCLINGRSISKYTEKIEKIATQVYNYLNEEKDYIISWDENEILRQNGEPGDFIKMADFVLRHENEIKENIDEKLSLALARLALSDKSRKEIIKDFIFEVQDIRNELRK